MSLPADRLRWPVLIAGALVLACAVLLASWPLPARLGTSLPGSLDHPGLQGDLFFQWNLGQQMEQGRFPDHLRTDYLRVPEGQEFETKVAFSLNLALFTLLMLPFDLLPAHNLAVLLILLLNGLAMYGTMVARHRSVPFALGAAIAFAVGPFVFLKLDQGFVQKAMIFTVPPFLLFVLQLTERFRWRSALGAGAMVVLAAAVYPPYAAYNLLFAAILVPASLAARRRWRGALGTTGGLVAFGAVLLLFSPQGGGGLEVAFEARAPATALDGTLDPFRPFRWHPYRQVPPGAPVEFVRSLPMGLPVLATALCLVAAFRRRGRALPLLLAAGTFSLLMAGPYLARGGELVTIAGHPIPLPLALVGGTPYSLGFNYPVRLAPWVIAALLIGAGDGDRWLREWLSARAPGKPAWVAIASVLLALALVVEGRLLFPEYRRLHVEEVTTPEYCSLIPEGAATLHLPYHAPGPHVYEFACVLCDRPTANSSLAASPPQRIPLPGDPEEVQRAFLDELAQAGVSHVLVHPPYYAEIGRMAEHHEPSLGPPELGHSGRAVESWLSMLCGASRQFVGEGVHAYPVPGFVAADP